MRDIGGRSENEGEKDDSKDFRIEQYIKTIEGK